MNKIILSTLMAISVFSLDCAPPTNIERYNNCITAIRGNVEHLSQFQTVEGYNAELISGSTQSALLGFCGYQILKSGTNQPSYDDVLKSVKSDKPHNKYKNSICIATYFHAAYVSNIAKPIGAISRIFVNIKQLNLQGAGLTYLPDGIFSGLDKLTELNLSGNCSAKQIEFLSPAVNQLECLPDGIFSGLDKLTNLDLGGNKLTSLPSSTYKLTALKELSVRKNKLTSISDGISSLKNLEELFLDSNELTEIPYSIDELKCLKDLSLFPNQISAISFKMNRLLIENNRNLGE
ncbi:leucine-rich repeat protein [Candidatus Cytomitobacter indipagum]|uniref:Leucine-rich repeat protein n=1 Tax=Candidatus Cytomitobacter indipagum TaxID=2601575 RepID=A0A5C0UEM5_9PROT|nr:leucine-rich repeat domain-containing protein [Candidatus Cytomitobacter indipagum]QEK38167.1 leucine-rich repeat protein [Candidatus Cytomitobacter indipagum]